MKHVFEQIKHTATKHGKCSVCGKRTKRSKTFWQTVNPWNRMHDGEVKSHEMIEQQLTERSEAWKQEPVTCAQCEEGQE